MSTKVTMAISESATSSPKKLGCNVHILMTKDGVLKIFELLIPIICVTMMAKGYLAGAIHVAALSSFALFFCNLVCALPTLLLLISHLMSPITTSMIRKIAYDFLNNGVSCLFYLTVNMTFLILIATSELENKGKPIAVAVFGLVNALLYFASAYFSYKAFQSS